MSSFFFESIARVARGAFAASGSPATSTGAAGTTCQDSP